MATEMLSHKVIIDGKQMYVIRTPSADLFLVKLGARPRGNVPSDQTVKTLMPRLAQAISKPGIRRESVFRNGCRRTVYAYSMNPANAEQLVREDAQGRRTLGRMVNGRFIPVRSGD